MSPNNHLALALGKASLNENATTTVFRFMDLPREIRDMVYSQALTLHHPRARSFDQPSSYNSISLAILRCNKQVNNEASRCFAKSNKFIHVITDFMDMARFLTPKPIHFVNVKCDKPHVSENSNDLDAFYNSLYKHASSIASYKHLGMTVRFFCSPPNVIGGEGIECHFVLLQSDLDKLCEFITVCPHKCKRSDFVAKSRLDLQLHPVFETVTAELASPYLTPFTASFRGLKNVKVRGCPGTSTFINTVKSPRWMEKEQPLKALQKLKDDGSVAFKAGRYDVAADIWTKAYTNAQLWYLAEQPGMSYLARGGQAYRCHVDEMQFTISLNAAAASLKLAQLSRTSVKDKAYHAGEAGIGIESAGVVIESSRWKPSTMQLAKLYYRCAVSRRMLGILNDAFYHIHHTLSLSPQDQAIKQEHLLMHTEMEAKHGRLKANGFAREMPNGCPLTGNLTPIRTDG